MYLEELTNCESLENRTLECKSRLNRDDVVGWLKTIAGFANANGGDFFIGVEDKTHRLIGFDRADADRERNYFNNQASEHLTPRPQMEISFLPYEIRGAKRYLIRVHVPESAVKPVILKYKNIPSIFMRRDGFTNGATYEEIIEMGIKSKNTQYDTLPSGETFDPKNFTTLGDFYAAHNDGKKLTEKALRSMGFYDEKGLLANGAVLFADDYHGKKNEALCSVFSGFHKGSKRIVTVTRLCGNLIAVLNGILEFVTLRMNHGMVKQGTSRVNIDAYPQRALFEGVVNAIAHRDYYLDGTQIQVEMYRDRLEISSPGGFYRGEKFGKTYDLSGIISKRRNELITAILVRCNVMEAAGTGFDKIAEEYAGVDDAHRPYIFSSSDHFTLVLPDLTYQDGIQDSRNPLLQFVPAENGTAYDAKVLSFCYYQAHNVAEIAKHLGISNSTYLRTKILANLEGQGYLEKDTANRAAYYKTVWDMVEIV